MKSKRSKSGIKNMLVGHLNANKREYTIISIIFLIGLVVGVLFINNAGQNQVVEISTYINDFVTALKNNIEIDYTNLLKDSIKSNLLLAASLWFVRNGSSRNTYSIWNSSV